MFPPPSLLKKKERGGETNSKNEALLLIMVSYSLIIVYFSRLRYTSIASIIGKTIMEMLYLKDGYRFMDNSKKKTKSPIKLDDYLKYRDIDTIMMLRIGDYFISLLSQFPHKIFERDFEKSTKDNKEVAKIKINSEFIDSVINNIIISAENLPMISKTLKWSYKSYGGYLKIKN